MKIKLTRAAMLDTRLRIYMFALLRAKNIPFRQHEGVIEFNIPREYEFMLALGSKQAKQQLAQEFNIVEAAFQ